MALDIQMRMTSASASDPSQFVDLDTQIQHGSYRGLAVAASIYAAAYFLAFTSGWITVLVAGRRWFAPPMFDSVVAVISIAYAVFTVYKSRSQRCQACQFTAMAIWFLVLASAGIAANFWGWEQQHSSVDPGVSWVGVWLVAYPAVVTPSAAAASRRCFCTAITWDCGRLAPAHGTPRPISRFAVAAHRASAFPS